MSSLQCLNCIWVLILTLKLQLNSLGIREIRGFECICRCKWGGDNYPVILYLYMFNFTPLTQSVSSLADKRRKNVVHRPLITWQTKRRSYLHCKAALVQRWPPSLWMYEVWIIYSLRTQPSARLFFFFLPSSLCDRVMSQLFFLTLVFR